MFGSQRKLPDVNNKRKQHLDNTNNLVSIWSSISSFKTLRYERHKSQLMTSAVTVSKGVGVCVCVGGGGGGGGGVVGGGGGGSHLIHTFGSTQRTSFLIKLAFLSRRSVLFLDTHFFFLRTSWLTRYEWKVRLKVRVYQQPVVLWVEYL